MAALPGILDGGHSLFVYLLSFLVALALLIFVHEFGHFIVARKLGVGVTKFSFGFGPKLVGFTRGDTEYLISAVPFGGYVKLVGEGEGEDVPPEEREKSFFHKPIWVKIAVVAAGPAGNLVFAVLVFWMVFLGGVPTLTARIGVAPDSPAAKAGLASGDVIESIGGRPVANWEELSERIGEAERGRPIEIAARRDASGVRVTVIPESVERKDEFGDRVSDTGIGITPALSARIGDVMPGSPAARAGLRKGDLLLAAGGQPVRTWDELAGRIRKASAGAPLVLVVRRGAEELSVSVVPEVQEFKAPNGEKVKEPKIGIVAGQETILRRMNPAQAFVRAGAETGKFIALTAKTVVKLITRAIPAKTLGGPLLIAQIAGDQARQGISPFLYFLGLLSVNLGILNLFPIPILDGGQILFFGIEALRRRPLSPQARAFAQQIGIAIILMLTVLVFYNDIARMISR